VLVVLVAAAMALALVFQALLEQPIQAVVVEV
jgi:hypothetical protein